MLRSDVLEREVELGSLGCHVAIPIYASSRSCPNHGIETRQNNE